MLCREAEFFVSRCVPLLAALCKAAPEGAFAALLEAGAIAELFTSNMKRGTDKDRAATRQLLWRLAHQVRPSPGLWGLPHVTGQVAGVVALALRADQERG